LVRVQFYKKKLAKFNSELFVFKGLIEGFAVLKLRKFHRVFINPANVPSNHTWRQIFRGTENRFQNPYLAAIATQFSPILALNK